MSRPRISRDILADRFRRWVLKLQDDHLIAVGEETPGGGLVNAFAQEVAPELGEPDAWKQEVFNNRFWLEEERRDLYALLWSYVVAGILQPISGGPRNQSRGVWDHLLLTDFGRRTLEGDIALPEAVAEYMGRLRQAAPNLDALALFYVEQALRAFRVGLVPSSVVMLGCATEHVVEEMARKLVLKLGGSPRQKLQNALDTRSLAVVWALFRQYFEPFRTKIFVGMAETSETALDGLFLVYKRARDNGGHPAEIRLEEINARELLVTFIEFGRYASVALAGIPTLP
jgi:hypothetical protein